jgi:chromosome segregation ATPase
MNLLSKKEPVVPMPRANVIDIENEIGNLARTVKPSLGDPRNMERAKALLTTGLTSAYDDGASALEAAVKEADAEMAKLKQAVETAEGEMDKLKRQAAEHILELKNKSAELTALVESRVEHLTSMVRWIQDQRVEIKNPQLIKPAIEPPKPADLIGETTED